MGIFTSTSGKTQIHLRPSDSKIQGLNYIVLPLSDGHSGSVAKWMDEGEWMSTFQYAGDDLSPPQLIQILKAF